MSLRALLALAALAPLLAAPAAGEVHVEALPDRAFLLVMQGVSFNAATWPGTPLLEAYLGEDVQFTVVVPPSAEPHTFHLHGHPWFVPAQGRTVDTVLLEPGDVHAFRVVAGGVQGAAGDWMYHCHFDDHVEGGMWGVFRVHPYATRILGAGPAFEVRLDRLGAPLDGATLALALDGADVPARVAPLGDGRYAVHAALDPATRGVLTVTATHALGESVARVGLSGAPVPTPTLAATGGHAH